MPTLEYKLSILVLYITRQVSLQKMASPAVYMQVGSKQKVGATMVNPIESAKNYAEDLKNASKNRALVNAQRLIIIDDADIIKELKEENAKTNSENGTTTPARPWYQSCTIT